MKTILRYLVVWLFAVLLPALLLWSELDRLRESNAAISILLAFVFSTMMLRSVHSLSKFPGDRQWTTIMPMISVWYGILFSIIALLRLEYSVGYLVLSYAFSLVIVHLEHWYFETRKPLRLGYVPAGRASDPTSIPNAEWLKLDAPTMPSRPIDAVVADLHAPNLGKDWQKFLAKCTLSHMPVYNIRQVEESLSGRIRILHMYENNLGSLLPSDAYMLLKRLFESLIICASAPLVVPVMVATAIIIKIESEGPVIFKQQRVGLSGREFTIYKFRSMSKDSEKDGAKFATQNDMRVTKFGRIIRKTRIDELPQFWNVLCGDMSLIGPRPEQKKFVDEFEDKIPFYTYRHVVRPGITGWAQVTHGYAADADETQIKIEHDFYYIKNFSFGLDFLIVLKTLHTMLTGFGAR